MSDLTPIQQHSLAPVKISQRPTKSCTECVRRKSRCDKLSPCDRCIQRGVPHLCRREPQYAVATSLPQSRKRTLADEVEALRSNVCTELDALRRRVLQLESRSQPSSIGPPSLSPTEGSLPPSTTLESLALGVDRRRGPDPHSAGCSTTHKSTTSLSTTPDHGLSPNYPHILPVPSERPIPDSVPDALLPRPIVHAILQWAEANVLWQHCCVFFPRFWPEVDTFWDTVNRDPSGWSLIDPTWVALFFALQAIAVHQMTDADAKACGLAEDDRFVLPTALIAAVEDALTAGQFLSRPTIWTVQVCAFLAGCGHNVCESALISSLLAVGIKTAQTLGLHSLGSAAASLARVQAGDEAGSSASIIDVELGKRLWWTLCQQDWYEIPQRGVWCIHPDHFDTPIPNNCHDQDIRDGRYVSRESTVVTVALKQRFSSRVASILQKYFADLNRSPTSLALAEAAASKIRVMIESLPSTLDTKAGSYPPWTRVMLHYILISALHKILVIYRAFLSRGGDGSNGSHGQQDAAERSRAHAACIEAAEAIIDELERGALAGSSQALWTIPYHCLSASVVLALDMIALNGHPQAATRKAAVLRARKALEHLAPTSRIARRGLQVLAELLREVELAGPKRGRRGSTSIQQVAKKIKLPTNELPEGVSEKPTENHPTPSLASQTHSAVLPAHSTTSPSTSQVYTPSSGGLTGDRLSELLLFSDSDTAQLLATLQQSVPDVGCLFNGVIGQFMSN